MPILDLETYNRVPTLESKVFKTILPGTVAVLFTSAAVCTAMFVIQPRPSVLLAWAGTFSVLALVTLIVIYQRRKRRCQFCGSVLDRVFRPFLLTSKYLAIQGVKQGDYFYMRSAKARQTGWVKISNQASACHHCRLTEEQHHECIEPATPAEIEALG